MQDRMVGRLLGLFGRRQGAGGKSSPGIPVIALVASVLFGCWLINTSLDPPKRRPLLGPVELANRAILVNLARKCQGDVHKLHGADLDQVSKLCGGRGEECIDVLYHDPHHGDGVYQYGNGQIH